jgi:hypothetical protein
MKPHIGDREIHLIASAGGEGGVLQKPRRELSTEEDGGYISRAVIKFRKKLRW